MKSGLLIPSESDEDQSKVDTSPYSWQNNLIGVLDAMLPTDGVMIVQPPGSGKTRGIAEVFRHLVAIPKWNYKMEPDRETGILTELYERSQKWRLQTLVVAEPFRALARQVANELYETLIDDDAWMQYNIRKTRFLQPYGDTQDKKEADQKKAAESIARLEAYFARRVLQGQLFEEHEQIVQFMVENNIPMMKEMPAGSPPREPRFFMEVQEGVVSSHVVPFKPLVVGTYENVSAMFNNLNATVTMGKGADEDTGDAHTVQNTSTPGNQVRAVVLDEFHNISKDRGIFIDNIIHAAAAHNKKNPQYPIAVILLSGTVTDALHTAINEVYDRSFHFTRPGGELIKTGKRPYAVAQAPIPPRKVLFLTGRSKEAGGDARYFNLASYFDLIRRWKDIPPGELGIMFAPTKSIAEALAIVAYAYLRAHNAPQMNQGSAELYSPRLVGNVNTYYGITRLASLELGLPISIDAVIGESDLWLDYGIYLDHANSNDQAVRESFQDRDSLLNVRFLIATTTIAEGFNILHARALALDYEGEDTRGNYTTVEPFFWDSAKYGQMLGRIGRYQSGVLFSGHTIDKLEQRVTIDTGPVRPTMTFQQKADFIWTLVWNAVTDNMSYIDYDADLSTFWEKGRLNNVLGMMLELRIIDPVRPDIERYNKINAEAGLTNKKLRPGFVAAFISQFINTTIIRTSHRKPPLSLRMALLVSHSILRILRWRPLIGKAYKQARENLPKGKSVKAGKVLEIIKDEIPEDQKEFIEDVAVQWVLDHMQTVDDIYDSLTGYEEPDWDALSKAWSLDQAIPDSFYFGWLIAGPHLPEMTNFTYTEIDMFKRAMSVTAYRYGAAPELSEIPHGQIFELIAGVADLDRAEQTELESEWTDRTPQGPGYDWVVLAYVMFPRWLASRMTDGVMAAVSPFSITMAEVASCVDTARIIVDVFPLVEGDKLGVWKDAFNELLQTYDLMLLARYSYQHGWTTDSPVLENFLRHLKSRWARATGSEKSDLKAAAIATLTGAVLGRRVCWNTSGNLHSYSEEYLIMRQEGEDVDVSNLFELDLKANAADLEEVESLYVSYKPYGSKSRFTEERLDFAGGSRVEELAKMRDRQIPINFIKAASSDYTGSVPYDSIIFATLPHHGWLRQLSTIITVE